MRVILVAGPHRAAIRQPNGTIAYGEVRFEAQVYSPGEIGAAHTEKAPPTPDRWLRNKDAHDMILIPPPSKVDGVPPVAIPAKILSSLPADAGVVMEWTWERRVK